jgi:hypothetical protein
MRDEFFLCKEQDSVPLLVNPDRMMDLPGGILDQENGAQFVETSKPLEAYLGLGFTPLIEKYVLVDTGQHEVLISPRGPGRTLQNIRDEVGGKRQHVFEKKSYLFLVLIIYNKFRLFSSRKF